ncbi:MAG TPA: anaerobic sulfatase maturase [Armatimonadota bacterium]|nr:anaerobic sulfatase maturase [Armatimonadota bacterium]HQK91901.1 anaerobic sulfatase maturase [Armatimonadota bacterium]
MLSGLRHISSILVKPAGPDCNLACRYCFYRSAAALYPDRPVHRMSDEVLESVICQYMAIAGPLASFGWQGGEPTLMGLPFFERVVQLQHRYGLGGQKVSNGLQTNGVLIDDDWARFLAQWKFLVGLSLDGPAEIHDHYRRDHGGRATHARVLEALHHLQHARVDTNVLCMVTDASVTRARELFDYFYGLGIRWMQFIPCVETHPDGGWESYSLDVAEYGQFLCALFDLWYGGMNLKRTYIRDFEELLINVTTGRPPSCVPSDHCGDYVVVEHNGDVYACDFHVTPEWRLGNLMETPLLELVNSPTMERFAAAKRQWDRSCTTCPWLNLCHGGCPKYRINANGAPARKTCFCAANLELFRHAGDTLRELADRYGPPSVLHRVPEVHDASSGVRGNAPCPCGSGRKYKHCCMKRG